MIKETEIKTNEKGQINRLTNNWTKKNPTQMDIETNMITYSEEDRHACKNNVQTMSKSEKNDFKCL